MHWPTSFLFISTDSLAIIMIWRQFPYLWHTHVQTQKWPKHHLHSSSHNVHKTSTYIWWPIQSAHLVFRCVQSGRWKKNIFSNLINSAVEKFQSGSLLMKKKKKIETKLAHSQDTAVHHSHTTTLKTPASLSPPYIHIPTVLHFNFLWHISTPWKQHTVSGKATCYLTAKFNCYEHTKKESL